MMEFPNVNIAAGNLYKVNMSIAKMNIKVMQEQQVVRSEIASDINSIQTDCFNSGIASAQDAKSALDKEADGLIDSGIVGCAGVGVSLGSLAPSSLMKFMGFGSRATKGEMDSIEQFPGKIKNREELSKMTGFKEYTEKTPVDPATSSEAPLNVPSKVPNDPYKPDDSEPSGKKFLNKRFDGYFSKADMTGLTDEDKKLYSKLGQGQRDTFNENLIKRKNELSDRVYGKGIRPNNSISENSSKELSDFEKNLLNRRLGSGDTSPDMTGLTDADERLFLKLNDEQKSTFLGNLSARKNELSNSLYEQVSRKLSNFSQIGNALGNAGNLAQGIYKEDQASKDCDSKEFSAQSQVYEQDCNSFSTFGSNAQQAANSSQEAALSIAMFNGYQG